MEKRKYVVYKAKIFVILLLRVLALYLMILSDSHPNEAARSKLEKVVQL